MSLDGVMVAMKDGGREAKRARTRAAGQPTKGPAGYQGGGLRDDVVLRPRRRSAGHGSFCSDA